MGSPLGPVLANLFMAITKKKWLQEFDDDDIFCMFGNKKVQKISLKSLTVGIKIKNLLLKKNEIYFCNFSIFFLKMTETVFQHQFIERKYQLGCLHGLIVWHQ